MRIKKHKVIVFGKKCEVELMHFTKGDIRKLKKLFSAWATLTIGLKEFRSRGANMPEGISEAVFCLHTGSHRILSLKGPASKSFDTFNLETEKAEQIKACSVEGDLTSFGPKSVWDDLYFIDFYNNGNIDGTFDIYKIPNSLIKKASVNKGQKFGHQQIEKRRPRLSIKKDIIKKYNLKPLAHSVKLWS